MGCLDVTGVSGTVEVNDAVDAPMGVGWGESMSAKGMRSPMGAASCHGEAALPRNIPGGLAAWLGPWVMA